MLRLDHQRFFDEYVPPIFKTTFYLKIVVFVRRTDDHTMRFDILQHRLPISEVRNLVSSSLLKLFRVAFLRVSDPNDFRTFVVQYTRYVRSTHIAACPY